MGQGEINQTLEGVMRRDDKLEPFINRQRVLLQAPQVHMTLVLGERCEDEEWKAEEGFCKALVVAKRL